MAIQGKYIYSGEDISKLLYIRNQVFGDNSHEYNDFDYLDHQSIHVVAFSDVEKCEVATGRIVFDGDNYSISKVAVLEKYRGYYYGDFIVRMLAVKAFMAGAQSVMVKAPAHLIPFFEKIGFLVEEEQLIDIKFGEIQKKFEKIVIMKLYNGKMRKKCINMQN